MRKILMALIVATITLCFLSCNSKEENPKPIVMKECPECKDYSKEGFGGVPVMAAMDMANLYDKNHYPQYRVNGLTQDSKSVWFSLDSIKKFIYNIEKAMCDCNGEMRDNLGVRIYFAEYPDAGTLGNAPSSSYYSTIDTRFGGMHTLFMVPTYHMGNTDFDFDPWNLGENGCKQPTTICERINSGDSTFLNGNILALSPQASRGVKNHGNLCPPLCPEGASCFSDVKTDLQEMQIKRKK